MEIPYPTCCYISVRTHRHFIRSHWYHSLKHYNIFVATNLTYRKGFYLNEILSLQQNNHIFWELRILANSVCELAKTMEELTKTVWELAKTVWELTKTVWELAKTLWELAKTVWELAKTVWELAKTVRELRIGWNCVRIG